MIVQRVVTSVVVATAAVVAAVVTIVAAVYAVSCLLINYIGPAGTAAVIIGVVATALGVSAAIFLGRGDMAKPAAPQPTSAASLGLPGRLFDLAQNKPAVAAMAAVAAGLLAWRNPRLVNSIARVLEVGRERA